MLAKRIRRYKIMEKHMELVKKGEWEAARLLLHLLRSGWIRLGLGDDDWTVESFLDDIGCPVFYGRNGYSATYRM